jgi:hypothetical protein
MPSAEVAWLAAKCLVERLDPAHCAWEFVLSPAEIPKMASVNVGNLARFIKVSEGNVLTAILIHGGLRVGEGAALKWNDVHWGKDENDKSCHLHGPRGATQPCSRPPGFVMWMAPSLALTTADAGE